MTVPKKIKIYESPPCSNPYLDHLSTLTSLRFFAAFWVVLFHFSTVLPEGSIKNFSFVSKGYMAVDFFFILSGFIIAHVYMEKFRNARISLKEFYIKRLARIYPVHFFTLCLYVVSLLIIKRSESFGPYAEQLHAYYEGLSPYTVASNLFLLHGWGTETTLLLNKPSWSISAEWFAYLFFPALVALATRINSPLFLFTSVLIVLSFWFASPVFDMKRFTQLTFDYSILRIMPEFLMGIGLYLCGRKYKVPIDAPLFFYMSLFSIPVFLLSGLSDIMLVFLFALVIYMAAESDRENHRGFFQSRALVFLGEASYSLYMIHFLVLDAVYVFIAIYLFGNRMPPETYVLIWLGMFPFTIVVSILVHELVEKPARNFINSKIVYDVQKNHNL